VVNRLIGVLSAVLMLAANATLVHRDLLPGWLAGDPPQPDDLPAVTGVQRRVQTAIFNAEGRAVGRAFTTSVVVEDQLQVRSLTVLYPIALPGGLLTPAVKVDTDLQYRLADGLLDELRMTIRGLPNQGIAIKGELIEPDQFACTLQAGALRTGMLFDAGATRALGDVVRPFVRLPGLYVGRTWRLQLLDPLSRILPGMRPNQMLTESELVRVTRQETIVHRGQPVETFVVETRRMRAWATRDGQVLRQEIELPVLGRLTLLDEPFNEAIYTRCRNMPVDGPDDE
jgi:hypothetical protein